MHTACTYWISDLNSCWISALLLRKLYEHRQVTQDKNHLLWLGLSFNGTSLEATANIFFWNAKTCAMESKPYTHLWKCGNLQCWFLTQIPAKWQDIQNESPSLFKTESYHCIILISFHVTATSSLPSASCLTVSLSLPQICSLFLFRCVKKLLVPYRVSSFGSWSMVSQHTKMYWGEMSC